MKPSFALPAAAAIAASVVAVVFATLYLTDRGTEPGVERACGDRIFGHIESLVAQGDGFELRFDPAWFTSGVTANTAAAEDGAVEPGEPVPNDNYVVDDDHRLLTYLVPAETPVTVLTNETGLIEGTPIDVSELARIVNGGRHRPLFEPLDSGVWLRANIDTACSLDQQYRP